MYMLREFIHKTCNACMFRVNSSTQLAAYVCTAQIRQQNLQRMYAFAQICKQVHALVNKKKNKKGRL